MATYITDFREAIRSMLGDIMDPPTYGDAKLEGGIRTVLRSGRIVYGTPAVTYALSGLLQVTPEVTDPNAWFLIAAHTARMFAAGRPDSMSFSTRGFSQSIRGQSRALAWDLEEQIARIESGGVMFAGWLDYKSWLEGMSGVRSGWLALVEARVTAPVDTVAVP